MKVLSLAGAFLALAAPPVCRGEVAPTPAALALARGLQASEMGVDREGNLWTWDTQTGQVTLYSPGGDLLARARAASAVSVQADRTWGIVGVFEPGTDLRLLAWDGSVRAKISLADRAQAAAWIGPEVVAVSPALAAHRVEIWNVRTGVITRKIGTEQLLTPKPGVTRLRTVTLHYEPRRGLLYTLESFTGDLEVFDLEGRLVRHAAVPPVKRAIEDFWARQDEESRAANRVQTPAIWWYWLAVDDAGTSWIVLRCDRNAGTASVLKVPLAGEVETLVLPQPCCSRSMALWGGWAVFYSDPTQPRAGCDNIRRLHKEAAMTWQARISLLLLVLLSIPFLMGPTPSNPTFPPGPEGGGSCPYCSQENCGCDIPDGCTLTNSWCGCSSIDCNRTCVYRCS